MEKHTPQKRHTHCNSHHHRAFAKVKKLTHEAPALNFPDVSREFVTYVDANEADDGAFAVQQKGDDIAIMSCLSQRSNDPQRNYSATLEEPYTIVSNI